MRRAKSRGRLTTVLVVLNWIFWFGLLFGLLAFVLTNPMGLVVGGVIILLLLGSGLLYFGIRGNVSGLTRPIIARTLPSVMGAISLLIGAALLGWTIHTGVPTRKQNVQQKIEEARRNGASSLDLSDMRLTEIPSEVFRLTSLNYLNLSFNRLDELPEEIGDLDQLTNLDVSYNHLISVPAAIGNLASLEYLYLRHNDIAELPPEVGRLANLETLNIAENRLESLPDEIRHLTDLRHLILFENDLTALPSEVAQLQNLQIVAVEYNQISSLPDGLSDLPKLHTLRLTGNPIYDLPMEITLRADSEDFTLEHDPDKREPPSYSAGAVNAFFILSLVAIAAATYGINVWINIRNTKIANQLSTRGQVFPVPPFSRGHCILVLLLSAFITPFLIAEGIRIWRAGEMLTALVLPLILSPLWLICIYLLVHNSGFVVLTLEAVIVRRLWREKRAPYGAITDIKELTFALPPNIVIKAPNKMLRIPRSVEDFDTLYSILIRAVDPVQEAEALNGRSPLDLRVPTWVSVITAAGVLVLVLIYIGIGLIGFWLPLVHKATPTFPPAVAMLIFETTSLLFIPLIVFYVLDALKVDEPAGIVFLNRAIRFRFPFKEWRIRSQGDIVAVDLKADLPPVKIAIGPFRIKRKSQLYPLTIRFTGGQELRISKERARQFGTTPEHIYTLLQDLYSR